MQTETPYKPNPCAPGAAGAPGAPAPGGATAVPAFPDIVNVLNRMLADLDEIKNNIEILASRQEPFERYYDTPKTAIAVATPVQPSNPDILSDPNAIPPNTGYQAERVYATLNRRAPRLSVLNDGTDTLFVITTSDGVTWSSEDTILTGEGRAFYDVFELRLRSPTAGNLTTGAGGIYRVVEREYWLAYVKMVASSTPGGFNPINKASIVNTVQPAASTNIITALLGAKLAPSNAPSTFRVQVAMSNGGTFSAVINDGVNPDQVLTLNVVPGPALVAGGLYIFDVNVQPGWTVDFQYTSTGGTIEVLSVQELDSAAA